jgi:hypothetical protein
MHATSPDTGASILGSVWNGLRDFVVRWDRFWFKPSKATTLGLMRICTGVLALYVHLTYSFDLQALMGKDAWNNLRTMNDIRLNDPHVGPPADWDESFQSKSRPAGQRPTADEIEYARRYGVDPVVTEGQGQYRWSIWFHVTDPTWMAIIHGSILFVMFLFTIGFCTRITSVLTWLAALSYVHRSPTTLFGQDVMMNILLIYLCIGASGAALSVDRLLTRYFARKRALRDGLPMPDSLPLDASVSTNIALRMTQIHFCLIYLASGTSKLLGASWWNGTALWGTLANYSFSPMDYQVYNDFLVFLANHRVLWELSMTGGTLFTLVLEIGFPFLVWNRRLRWLMIVGAVALHTGIALFMGLTVFGLFMITMLLSFIPAETVQQALDRLFKKNSSLPVNRVRTDRAVVAAAQA